MGITIHYTFVIRNNDVVTQILKEVKDIALKLGMKIMRDNKTSLILHPHPGCESLNLDFSRYGDMKENENCEWFYLKDVLKKMCYISDDDFVCSSFTKTQYAGFETHILVAELLRKVASKCTLAYVSDEADYYETRDRDKMIRYFDESSKMISEFASKLKQAFGNDKVLCAMDGYE